MNKGTHFNGQPMYGQLISLLVGNADAGTRSPQQKSIIWVKNVPKVTPIEVAFGTFTLYVSSNKKAINRD